MQPIPSLRTATLALHRRLEVPHPPDQPRPTWLISEDIRPIEKGRRVWGWSAYFSFWSVLAFNISNFQIGSSLLALGLNWWQTILATLVGHLLAAGFVLLSGYPGLEYHISFPIATRIAWGFYGSIFVILNRIVLSILWFGIQSWFGGLLTYVCLRAMWPSIDHIPNTFPASTGMTVAQFVGFMIFWIIQLPFLLLKPARLKYLLYVSAGGGFLVQLILVSWACGTKGPEGFGSVLSRQNAVHGSKLGWMFLYGVSTTVSSIISGVLSICDYTRFARRPSDAVSSQVLGAIPAWLSNVFGILTIAATQRRYGAALWSLPSLLIAIQTANPTSSTRVAVFFCAFFCAVPQLGLNVAGNAFSGGTDMSSLLPKYINIRRGQLITACIGLAINPWYLLSSALVFISVMSSYTIFLQPMLGVLVAHYYVIQKRRIRVADLYSTERGSLYFYRYGVNWRVVISWATGMAPHLPGFLNVVNPSIKVGSGAIHMYYLTSITAFVIPFVTTILLDLIAPVKIQKEFVQSTSARELREQNELLSEIEGVAPIDDARNRLETKDGFEENNLSGEKSPGLETFTA